jgi:hypothetical protein
VRVIDTTVLAFAAAKVVESNKIFMARKSLEYLPIHLYFKSVLDKLSALLYPLHTASQYALALHPANTLPLISYTVPY